MRASCQVFGQVNATKLNDSSGKGLVKSGNTPLPEPAAIETLNVTWRH